MAKKNIAIGGISTECSSYSPLFQNKEDFRTVRGKICLTSLTFHFSELQYQCYPLFFNKSVPGAQLIEKYFDEIKNQFITEINAS